MRFKSIIFLFIICILTPLPIFAHEQASQIDKLDQISDEALQMVKSARYDDAIKILDYFSNQFLAYTMENSSFSEAERRMVSMAHSEAVEAIASTTINYDERLNRMTKFRLVIDAVTTTQQPLWTEMKGPVMSVFNEMKEAVYKGDHEGFHTHLNSLLVLYEIIYPSMKLDTPFEKVQEIDARMAFIDQYRPKVLSDPASQRELPKLEKDLNNLFDGATEDEADPSLWWVIFTTGSIIILTLSYVGWRKYEGDKERKREKNRN